MRDGGEVDPCLDRQRALQRLGDPVEASQGGLVGRSRRNAGHRPNRADHRDQVAHRIEHHHHPRPHEDRVGDVERVGIRLGQPLHGADHVVAEIAEQARRHRRERRAFVLEDRTLGDQRAQGVERRALVGGEVREVAAGERGAAVAAAPCEVGIEADHRVAPAHDAAFDRFEQEGGAGMAGTQLQESGDRRLEVGHLGQVEEGRASGLVGRCVGGIVGRVRHRPQYSPPIARRKAAWLTLTPAFFCTSAMYSPSTSSASAVRKLPSIVLSAGLPAT